MKRIATCCVLFGLFVTISQCPYQCQGQERGQLFVLSVGVEPKLTARGKFDIYAQDAKFVGAALAAAESLFTSVNSYVLGGADANRDNVLRHLGGIAKEMRASDTCVMHFSTHGYIDPATGYRISLAGSHGRDAANGDLLGVELQRAVNAMRGKTVVLLDTCCAAGVIPARGVLHDRVVFVTACGRQQSSYGQSENRKRPHGYFVIALCEALGGAADENRDGQITVSEVVAYLPARAKAMCDLQDAVVGGSKSLASLALTKAKAADDSEQPYDATGQRNPFGLADVAQPLGADVREFAKKTRLPGGKRDANAEVWNTQATAGSADSIDGQWEGRWNSTDSPDSWSAGQATIKTVGERVFILLSDGGSKYLIEARRGENERLAGRYVNLNDEGDSTPWAGRIIDSQRIDGKWTGGRWDLRRKLALP